MRQMIKQWPKQSEATMLSTSFENCQGIRYARQKHTTMVLPFKIKLKKDCTNNAFLDPCSISEVVKSSSKMTLLYSKIAAVWHVQVKSLAHYFGSF